MSETGAQGGGASGGQPPAWSRLWQVPGVIGAGLLLTGALAYAVTTSPEPQFNAMLASADRLIESERYQDALTVLNDRQRGVWPWVARGEDGAPAEVRRRYHVLVARAIYLGQQDLELDNEENHLSVIREYQAAERLGATLEPEDVYRLADSYAAYGQPEVALTRASAIPSVRSDLRQRVRRRVVETWLDVRPRNETRALEELSDMLTDPLLPESEQVWALDRRADLQLRRGFSDEAVTRLLRALPRLQSAEPHELGRLHIKLAQAYLDQEAFSEAQRHVSRASEMVEPGSDDRGWVLLYQARIDEAQGELVEARDAFSEVVERYASTEAYAPALLGLAEAEAGLGAPLVALDVYASLIDELNRPRHVGGPTRERVTRSLLNRYLDQTSFGEFESALKFATLASELYAIDTTPADVLQALAQGHRDVASSILGGLDGERGVDRLADLGPAARAEAQRHLIRSAAYFREHASRFVLTDIGVFADSLWEAATLFDQAGDLQAASDAYREFVEGMPSDPRRAEAAFRLGLTQQAMGRHDVAVRWFRGLIETARGPDAADVGPWAIRSYVPLAQSYLRDQAPENDDEAMELLESAVSGGIVSTGAQQFHDALLELARLHYNSGVYPRAVERATEAIERYPDDPDVTRTRFLLADSHRLLADQIEATLDEPMPDAERAGRRRLIAANRVKAIELFEQVRRAYENANPNTLASVDRLNLRNSYFYMGDCAFDLEEYEAAIRYYDAARQRYGSDPASLVALVQIVAAHLEMGDIGRAMTANERAKRFYEQLPDDVWDDPTLPMDRKDWERWIEASGRLYDIAGG